MYKSDDSFADNKYKKTSHLKFEELSNEDVGRYLCVAKNIAGQVSREVDVHIQGRRIFSYLFFILDLKRKIPKS